MQQYCLYLRKSRADAEAEARGEGETLARHERTLLELAKRQQLNVTEIYKEIVSGESLAARPVMQHLLSEVEQGMWAGVLVMEVERLARGDTTDQGIVAQTFKFSGTLIITPSKTYNPGNEFDEEYFEFGLFMSRREYMTINRRLQRGRIASVKEGKFVGNIPPFGYSRIKIKGDKGFTLEPVPGEAEVVRLIFEWYANGVPQEDGTTRRLGCGLIAQKLNEMKSAPRKGDEWSLPSVRDILRNPVYIGMVRWNWRQQVKKMVDGKVKKSRPRSQECIVCKGLHPAIIDKDVFDRVQELLSKNPTRPVPGEKSICNPLAGLVYCGVCGKSMIRRPYQSGYPDTLLCPRPNCTNVSSDLRLVEDRVLSALRDWLDGYKLEWESKGFSPTIKQSEVLKKALSKQEAELDTLYKQLSKTHDLLEQGIYNTDTFLERSRSVSERINQTRESIERLRTQIGVEIAKEENVINVIPKVEHLLETYSKLPDAAAKNKMLKEVLEKVVYLKKKRARKKTDSLDDFEITILPKILPLP